VPLFPCSIRVGIRLALSRASVLSLSR
jgi:hypothetical protein